jgi:nicotinamidase-related amidase
MKKVHLLIIDPQNDFCIANGPNGNQGQLVVPGADGDMIRLAALINRLGVQENKIWDIHCTLDQHHYYDIAHPIMYKDEHGNHPNPFTVITNSDLKSRAWRTSNPAMQKWAEEYTGKLESTGRYPLMIWPPHCLISSWGACVVDDVYKAFYGWMAKGNMIDFVSKGSNWKTEHYSAFQTEVPIPEDPSTLPNMKLVELLNEADVIAIAGEALSHCVANTIRDISANFGDENIKKFVLLEDCSSNVFQCEAMGTAFVNEMTSRGMSICKSTDFLV